MGGETYPDDCAVSDRGGIVENSHRVHAAITDAAGKLLYAVGNPLRMTLARSAAKPFQTLALLETPGFDRFGFDSADVALMCASHSSEQRHVARARAMLSKVNASEGELRCGGHRALSDAVNQDWTKRDFTPGAICNNCSGKHVGMLAAAQILDTEKAGDYHLPDHALQVRVRRTFEELSGLSPDEIKWGIDGCNLPAPGLPLRDISHLYAILSDAADTEAREGASVPARTQHLAHIYSSMWRFPELVGGEGRFCTQLMSRYEGLVVGKLGADGCYGVAVRESPETIRLGAKGAIGIAVKIEDGDIEILYAVVMEILEQLNIGTTEKRRELDAFHYLKRINTAGVVTGNVSLPFQVRKI